MVYIWERSIDKGKGQNGEINKMFGILFTHSWSSKMNYEMILHAHYIYIPHSAFRTHTSMWIFEYLLFTWWIPNGKCYNWCQVRVSLIIFVVSLPTENWRKRRMKKVTRNTTSNTRHTRQTRHTHTHTTLMSQQYLCNAEAIDYPI